MPQLKSKVRPKFDETRAIWIDMNHEKRVEIAEPVADCYEYRVGSKPIRIEQTVFNPGTVLGTGTIKIGWTPGDWFCFNSGDHPLELIDPGRIAARLATGEVLAIPTGEVADLPKS